MQGLIAPVLLDLGFDDERPQKVGLAAFRPDFMLSIPGDAVMVEVERGKTLDNNMDMLDMWKCHVHGETRHLILLVPIWYVKTSKSGRISRTATFAKVCVRLSQFFRPGYYTNVRSLHVVGY